ncbi:MAG: diguanylate cyclase [Leptolyngbya sp. SIO4C1]|nr:diguanylate cyclase [Leptolyngbya sp. SIO4C1]
MLRRLGVRWWPLLFLLGGPVFSSFANARQVHYQLLIGVSAIVLWLLFCLGAFYLNWWLPVVWPVGLLSLTSWGVMVAEHFRISRALRQELEALRHLSDPQKALKAAQQNRLAAPPAKPNSVYQKIRALTLVAEALSQEAFLDGLTQIANRRGFDQYLIQEWQRSFQAQLPLSLILCDVDFFKRYNDTYGHAAGDICLKQVAHTLRKTVKRPADLVARYGGEEFAVILPSTDAYGAHTVGKAVNAAIAALALEHAQSEVCNYVTLSVGTATLTPSIQNTPKDLINTADQALYQAKHAGRNQVYPS